MPGGMNLFRQLRGREAGTAMRPQRSLPTSFLVCTEPAPLGRVSNGAVFNLQFSPTGDMLVAACEDSTVRVYDPVNRAFTHRLAGHNDCVNVVAFLDDVHFVTGGDDGVVCLWDARKMRLVSTMHGHAGTVKNLDRLSSNSFLSASWDGTIRIWHLDRSYPESDVVRDRTPASPSAMSSGSFSATSPGELSASASAAAADHALQSISAEYGMEAHAMMFPGDDEEVGDDNHDHDHDDLHSVARPPPSWSMLAGSGSGPHSLYRSVLRPDSPPPGHAPPRSMLETTALAAAAAAHLAASPLGATAAAADGMMPPLSLDDSVASMSGADASLRGTLMFDELLDAIASPPIGPRSPAVTRKSAVIDSASWSSFSGHMSRSPLVRASSLQRAPLCSPPVPSVVRRALPTQLVDVNPYYLPRVYDARSPGIGPMLSPVHMRRAGASGHASSATSSSVSSPDVPPSMPDNVVFRHRRLARARFTPATDKLAITLRDGSLVLVHDLDLATLQHDLGSLALASLADAWAAHVDTYSGGAARRGDADLFALPSACWRRRNRVELVPLHHRGYGSSLQLSADATALLDRHEGQEGASLNVLDLSAPAPGVDQLRALYPHAGAQQAARMRPHAATPVFPNRVRLDIPDSTDGPRYIKGPCFGYDDRVLFSPFQNGVRMFDWARVRATASSSGPVSEQSVMLKCMDNCHAATVLTTRHHPHLPILASGAVDGTVNYYQPEY